MASDTMLGTLFVLLILTLGFGIFVSNWRAYHALRVQPWWQLPQDRRTTFVRRRVLIFVGGTTLLTVWNLSLTHLPSPREFALKWGEVALTLLLLNLLMLSPAYIWYAVVRRRSMDHGDQQVNAPR